MTGKCFLQRFVELDVAQFGKCCERTRVVELVIQAQGDDHVVDAGFHRVGGDGQYFEITERIDRLVRHVFDAADFRKFEVQRSELLHVNLDSPCVGGAEQRGEPAGHFPVDVDMNGLVDLNEAIYRQNATRNSGSGRQLVAEPHRACDVKHGRDVGNLLFDNKIER